jgi:hypothetical protein
MKNIKTCADERSVWLSLPFVDDDDDAGNLQVLVMDEAVDPVGFGSIEANADWLANNWLNNPAPRKQLKRVWSKIKPKIDSLLSWQEGLMDGPYLALLVYAQLWSAGKLNRLRRCEYEACGRIFFARKNQKYCRSECFKAAITASYDTDEYREKKRKAMRERRKYLLRGDRNRKRAVKAR